MNIEDLEAIEKIRLEVPPANSWKATYLCTYPALVAGASTRGRDITEDFLRTAALAYGWMPRILRVAPEYLGAAVTAFKVARKGTEPVSDDVVAPIAACLSSVVGASKVLHFSSPKVFPIWDSKVEQFRKRQKPSQYHMDQILNYLSYMGDVQWVRSAPEFPAFYQEPIGAYEKRLRRLHIPAYRLTEVRAIEAAIFELAGESTESA